MDIETEKLKKMPFNKQLVFAYLMCERLYPNYVYFSQNCSFGDSLILRKAIDHIRQYISGIVVSDDEIQQDYNDVEVNTPDTDDFTTVHVALALNTCCAVLWTLKFLIDKNADYLVYISRSGIETADSCIFSNIETDVLSEEVEKSVLNNPIMKKEFSIQNEIVRYLLSHKKIEKFDVEFLMKL